MLIRHVKNFTRILGKSQGYLGLPIRDEIVNEKVSGPDTPAMVTAWEPTPKELELLNKGHSINVRILGTIHPPIYVWVDEDN